MRTTSRTEVSDTPGRKGAAKAAARAATTSSPTLVLTRAVRPAPFCMVDRLRAERATTHRTSTSMKSTPCTNLAAGCIVPSAMLPTSNTIGMTTTTGAERQRLEMPSVSAPPTSPVSQGSATKGPRASTGGSRVSQRFHPVTLAEARSMRVATLGRTPPISLSRTAKGPPRRK